MGAGLGLVVAVVVIGGGDGGDCKVLSNVAGLVDSIGLVELIVVDVERRVVIVVTKLKSVNYEGSLTRIKDGNIIISCVIWLVSLKTTYSYHSRLSPFYLVTETKPYIWLHLAALSPQYQCRYTRILLSFSFAG